MSTNAIVRVNISINTRYRVQEEQFWTTRVNTEAFNIETDLTSYVSAISTVSAAAYEAIQTRRAEGGFCTTYVDVWLENATHPTPAAGVVPLPKGNITGCLNDEEVVSSAPISDLLLSFVKNLQTHAGY